MTDPLLRCVKKEITNMRKVLYCLIGLTILLSNLIIVGCGTKTPQFDGVYQSEKVNNYWRYARFYEDGTVIIVSSTGNPGEIIRWFKKENIERKSLSHGLYEINGDRLVFSTTSAQSIVDYEGRIKDDAIIMDTYSHITGHRSNSEFRFVKLSEN